MTAFQSSSSQVAAQISVLIIASIVLIGACLLARHNVRQGKGDRRGAFRLSALLTALVVAAWALAAHHVPATDELILIADALSQALLIGAIVWVLYMALEPYVRRRWPHTMISWTRVLSGRIRDPLVGSRILAGAAAGVATVLLTLVMALIRLQSGALPTSFVVLGNLLGPSQVASFFLGSIPGFIGVSLAQFLLLFLLRAVFRKEWLAGAMFVLLFTTAAQLFTPTYTWWVVPLRMLDLALTVVVMIRGGMVAFVTASFVSGILICFPMTTDFSAWYSGYSIFVLAVVSALAGFSFHTALAGRPLFQKDIFEA